MNHFAKKSLGQHFLMSDRILDKIVEAAEISKEDTIFEIGPGTGNLTRKLLDSPAREIIAVEKDDNLYFRLSKELKTKKLKLIHQDALLLIPNLIAKPPLKVVANLPYNIASPAIISLLTVCPTLPETMVVMLQKEVAERIVCPPGNSNRGLLTVFIELFGTAKIVEKVGKGSFRPVPQVDSAVVRIVIGGSVGDCPPHLGTVPRVRFAKHALKVLKAAFSGKRKKIKNSLFSSWQFRGLSPAFGDCAFGDCPPRLGTVPMMLRHFTSQEAQSIAQKCGFSLDQRPEELTKEQWANLIALLSSRT